MAGKTLRQNPVYQRRLLMNDLAMVFAVAMMALGLIWLIWVLATLIYFGIGGVGLDTFTKMTPAVGMEGGLLNAIVGSAIITTAGIALGTPIGILAGTYLAEYGRGWFSWATGFISSVLLSAPSIVVGLFVYAIYVHRVRHFSGWSGAVALAIILLPVVVTTTADMLRLTPQSLREAAAALGAPKWKIVVSVVYPAARRGILTGVMLGGARILGESAPLLFTAMNNQFWSLDMNQPMANLPIVIFQFAMSPYENLHELAWAAALLITFAVLGLNILARSLVTIKR